MSCESLCALADEMRCYWFELFECTRKLLLLGGPIFFEMDSASQLVVGLFVCFISSVLDAAYSPYIDKNDGRLAQVCQLSLFFVLVSTIALRHHGERSADTLGVLLVVTLFVPPAAAILLHTRSSML
jgi:drug/metabolite transporter (DMT)-like permease